MSADMETRLELWRLCLSCATGDERIAKLLFGTAAQESNFIWRRQTTCRWDGEVGGFGLWQVEYSASVLPSIGMLGRRVEIGEWATRWLWQDRRAGREWLSIPTSSLLWLLRGWDRIGCLFARLHYLRVAERIPESLDLQAAYWKHYYNTSAGKGTPEQYLGNWGDLCAPVLTEWRAARLHERIGHAVR